MTTSKVEVSDLKFSNFQLSFEHNSYRWANAKDLESLPLRAGVKEALQYYKKGSPSTANTKII